MSVIEYNDIERRKSSEKAYSRYLETKTDRINQFNLRKEAFMCFED